MENKDIALQLTTKLLATPDCVQEVLSIARETYPQSIITKPVTSRILHIISADPAIGHWLTSVYVEIVSKFSQERISAIETMLYTLYANAVDANNNMAFDDELRAIQHTTLDDVDIIVSSHIYMRTVYLFKGLGAL